MSLKRALILDDGLLFPLASALAVSHLVTPVLPQRRNVLGCRPGGLSAAAACLCKEGRPALAPN